MTDAFHKAVLDAIPDPVFVVDADVSIVHCNEAAAKLAGGELLQIINRRSGDALHCSHSTEAGGCGNAPACQDCAMRNSVKLAFRGDKPLRVRHRMEVTSNGRKSEVELLVTTAPIQYQDRSLALLVLEDITELVALRRILPICSHCRKVRDDNEYWQNVEAYLGSHLEVDFSHGICPDCLKRHYPDYADKP